MKRRTQGTEDADERANDAEREAFGLREERSHTGTTARELELRALAVQHRAAYTAFVLAVEKAAVRSQRDGWAAARRFLVTYAKADVHLGGVPNPVSSWYIRTVLRSPVYVRRMVEPGSVGDEARARFEEYVEEYAYHPAFEALWRQLGGAEQESRPT